MRATTRERAKRDAPRERPLAPGEEPPLGAHLVSPRRFYTHHGVYVGAGRVVHYAGLSSTLHAGPVEEVSLEHFGAGRPISVRVDPAFPFDSEQVVQRALSRLGEQRYRVLTNNCEHFCEWCVRGHSRSRQVEAWLPRRSTALARNVIARLVTRRVGGAAPA
jgi:Lecithin retinol acyltransferase